MKKSVAILLLVFILTLLSGCGQPGAGEPADLPSPAENENRNWMQEGFAAPSELTTDQVLWAGRYLPVKHTANSAAPDASILYCRDFGAYGSMLWYLFQSQEAEYFLEIYDTASEKSTVKRFTLEELGLADRYGFLTEMDMRDETHYIFRWVGYEQDTEGMYCQVEDKIICTDFAGDLRTVDLWNKYLDLGYMNEKVYKGPLLQQINWHCDKAGNIYVIKQENNGSCQFCMFNQNGELLVEDTWENKQLTSSFRTPEGELLFVVYDSSRAGYDFLWADTAGKQMRFIAQTEASSPDIFQVYGMLGKDIYYRNLESGTDRIIKWNVTDGRQELVFDFREAGLGINYETFLALREGQTPVLYLSRYKEEQRKEWLVTLQMQKPTEADSVRVANLTSSKNLVDVCVTTADLDNPGFSYEYEDASAEEQKNRVLAELTQGNGPEIMLLSLEDMYVLQEKGALLDIRELISAKFLEELLPGALEFGTIDGKLYGIPPTVTVSTLVASAEVWPEDTWKLEDVIGLMEEGRVTCALGNLPHVLMGKYWNPQGTVMYLVQNSLADSFLIDWGNRKCHFDDERFIRLLELCSTDMSSDYVNQDEWLNGGKDILWGWFFEINSLFTFFEHMEMENGHIVGYPAEGTGGSYLAADGGVLAVSVKADREAATYFLETLIGREVQLKAEPTAMGVRRPRWEDYIREDSGRLLYIYSNGREMPVFTDGDTPFSLAEAFLENCKASPFLSHQIRQILIEELNVMYEENRSAQKTAEIINNRVQLYLDENN